MQTLAESHVVASTSSRSRLRSSRLWVSGREGSWDRGDVFVVDLSQVGGANARSSERCSSAAVSTIRWGGRARRAPRAGAICWWCMRRRVRQPGARADLGRGPQIWPDPGQSLRGERFRPAPCCAGPCGTVEQIAASPGRPLHRPGSRRRPGRSGDAPAPLATASRGASSVGGGPADCAGEPVLYTTDGLQYDPCDRYHGMVPPTCGSVRDRGCPACRVAAGAGVRCQGDTMNANRRLVRMTALLATAALVVTACSGSSSSPSASAPASSAGGNQPSSSPSGQPSSSPAGAPITLTIAANAVVGGKSDQEAAWITNYVIPTFEKQMAAQGENVTVKFNGTGVADEQYKAQLALDLKSGSGADVFDMDGIWIGEFAQANYIKPLNQILPAADTWDGWSQISPAVQANMSYQGQRYGI